MWLPAIWTLPSPARPPLPDRISRVTILVTRKVTRIARNIHIMGCSETSHRPTVMFTLDGSFNPAGIARGGSFPVDTNLGAVLAASTDTGTPPAPRPYARILRAGTAPPA